MPEIPSYVQTLRDARAAEKAEHDATQAALLAANRPYEQYGSRESRRYRYQQARDAFWKAHSRLTNPAISYAGLEEFGRALADFELWHQQAGPYVIDGVAGYEAGEDPDGEYLTLPGASEEEQLAFAELLDAARAAVA